MTTIEDFKHTFAKTLGEAIAAGHSPADVIPPWLIDMLVPKGRPTSITPAKKDSKKKSPSSNDTKIDIGMTELEISKLPRDARQAIRNLRKAIKRTVNFEFELKSDTSVRTKALAYNARERVGQAIHNAMRNGVPQNALPSPPSIPLVAALDSSAIIAEAKQNNVQLSFAAPRQGSPEVFSGEGLKPPSRTTTASLSFSDWVTKV